VTTPFLDATIHSVNLSERLLRVMDAKDHWAYPSLTRPGLTRAQLLVHFRHEYLVFVRDFPVLVARALGQTPNVEDVRIALAENIYEEQTGGLSKSAPHPQLFMKMMRGLGFSPSDFADDDTWLDPAARAYRDMLRVKSAAAPWQSAVALLTIFVEGSVNERRELAGAYVRPQGDDDVLGHPLVLHYGCTPDAMEIRRAHGVVEGGHRKDAWRMILENVPDNTPLANVVAETCEEAVAMWHAYRDAVAARMGLTRHKAA
jgi:Iron-containing redox enzyme